MVAIQWEPRRPSMRSAPSLLEVFHMLSSSIVIGKAIWRLMFLASKAEESLSVCWTEDQPTFIVELTNDVSLFDK
jgi:hypothetical protein